MKLFSLLLMVSLRALSSVECGCDKETRVIREAEKTNYVVCTQFIDSNCLHCKANGAYIKCDTKRAEQNDPAAEKGPAPNGVYAIGPVYTHKTHGISWANLYPRKQNDEGWWDYYHDNPDVPGSRSHIGLHPGSISWGCITVTDSSCWNNLESMLKSKTGDDITVSKPWWRTATVNRIGILRVVN